MLPTVDVLVAIISSPAHISQYLSMHGGAETGKIGLNMLRSEQSITDK